MANVNTRQKSDDPFTFDIMENLLVFGQRKDTGWTKEANIVCWNGGSPKLDIREWDPEHERMSKGATLYEAEAERLARVLCKRYGLGAGGRKKGKSSYESFSDDDELFEDENFAAADLSDEECAPEQESGAAAENAMTEEAEE